jgi:ABC-type polysaccharide/polyol phosphate transport system ATPase subunit
MSEGDLAMAADSSPPHVVQVESASLRYRIPQERFSGMKEFAIRWLQRRVRYIDLWALRDVDIGVERSEILGIIGRNGAGKSTLLKLIAGVLHPTEGRVRVSGTIAPLLGLGAGFHPELTGRENVYLYGALLGYNRHEMDSYFESIVEFAELSEFIDSPLRTYSSGMSLRLGFAVATCRYADVLLVDEVLAVGDVQFQAKCMRRMNSFRDDGASILFVSHDLGSMENICDRVIWLDEGRVVEDGSVNEVTSSYVEFLSDMNNEQAGGGKPINEAVA